MLEECYLIWVARIRLFRKFCLSFVPRQGLSFLCFFSPIAQLLSSGPSKFEKGASVGSVKQLHRILVVSFETHRLLYFTKVSVLDFFLFSRRPVDVVQAASEHG